PARHASPTRRSSDLDVAVAAAVEDGVDVELVAQRLEEQPDRLLHLLDRPQPEAELPARAVPYQQPAPAAAAQAVPEARRLDAGERQLAGAEAEAEAVLVGQPPQVVQVRLLLPGPLRRRVDEQ